MTNSFIYGKVDRRNRSACARVNILNKGKGENEKIYFGTKVGKPKHTTKRFEFEKYSSLKFGGLSRDTKLRFVKGSEVRKFLFGNKRNLKRNTGFDRRDGWVPGYKSLHRKRLRPGVHIFVDEREFIGSELSKNFKI